MTKIGKQKIGFNSYAKLNLRLKIQGRQSNGYHLLSMLNVLIDFSDYISLELIETPGIFCFFETGNASLDQELNDSARNLAARAAQFCFDFCKLKIGLNIKAKKIIPAGGGLGGGSSNAAGVLKHLPELLYSAGIIGLQKLNALKEELPVAALNLGADVAFFYNATGNLSIASGVGEEVINVTSDILDGLPILLLLVPISTSSKIVYERYHASNKVLPAVADEDAPLIEWLKTPEQDYESVLNLVSNDLQDVFFLLYPELKQKIIRLQELTNCKLSLSGSGSTFFVLPKTIGSQAITELEQVAKSAQNMGLNTILTSILANPFATQ